jgi:ERCC4-related helicase
MGCQPPQWASIPKRERTTRFNRAVLAAKERVVESLLTQADFWDHPKEKFVIDAIGKHGRRTFISVRDRDHAVFFAKRINALLSERGIHAVPLTGKGEGARKGISASERTSNLAAFNDGRASVIVGTSASNEGVDIDAEHGYIVVFDGSQTSAKQKEGRVGRRALGKVDYLCTTLEDQALRTDYLIVLQILRKDIAFLRLLNNERAKVTSLAGLASLPARSAKSPGKERNLSLFDRFTGA